MLRYFIHFIRGNEEAENEVIRTYDSAERFDSLEDAAATLVAANFEQNTLFQPYTISELPDGQRAVAAYFRDNEVALIIESREGVVEEIYRKRGFRRCLFFKPKPAGIATIQSKWVHPTSGEVQYIIELPEIGAR
jgi:hypothetical protein